MLADPLPELRHTDNVDREQDQVKYQNGMNVRQCSKANEKYVASNCKEPQAKHAGHAKRCQNGR
jgi:hypothetical protein